MLHRDHDISLLVPLLDILESVRDLLQAITSIDDRLELPSRGQCCDEIHSLRVFEGHTALYWSYPRAVAGYWRTRPAASTVNANPGSCPEPGVSVFWTSGTSLANTFRRTAPVGF